MEMKLKKFISLVNKTHHKYYVRSEFCETKYRFTPDEDVINIHASKLDVQITKYDWYTEIVTFDYRSFLILKNFGIIIPAADL